MKLRMYQPDELAAYNEAFRCFFTQDFIYVINIKTKHGYKFKDGEPIVINLNSREFRITKEAVTLWKDGLWQAGTLFDIHNACMIAYLNNERITFDTVEKYL